MRLITLIFIAAWASSVGAGDAIIHGVWDGGGTASMAIYGRLKISGSEISWGGHHKSHPPCKVTYTVVPEGDGVVFEDQVGNTFVTGKDTKFNTYLLAIKGGRCTSGITHFRLTVANDTPTYMAMIEYEGMDRPIGRMHFHKH